MLRAMRGMSVAVTAAATVALTATSAAPAPRPVTERVTLSATGEQLSEGGFSPDVSADGRYAVFDSDQSDLVPGDTNGQHDIFVRDLRRGTVERVDVASDGTQADVGSSGAAISADGRYVTFRSMATTLVDWPSPPYYPSDVYVHDRRTGRTERISVGADGGTGGAFDQPAVSADGRYVAFVAQESRMEAGNTGGRLAAYVADRRTGEVRRVSNRTRPEWSVQEVDLSADGGRLAYVHRHPRGGPGELMVVDLRTGGEEQANVFPPSMPADISPSALTLSADGRYVSFHQPEPSVAGHTWETYVRDLREDSARRIGLDGEGEGEPAGVPLLSPDGRYLAYTWATTTVGGEQAQNVYVRDLRGGQTRRVTRAVMGGPLTDGVSVPVSFARGNGLLALGSSSAQLVPGDTNGLLDGFVVRLH
ncbi:hypothetical protein GCM10010129_45540 [Streptomyces fumigatiscleroticus]|nr:hypothetical protein GCM10010129_45540 [Streptomyces fumigatiscleroticus]